MPSSRSAAVPRHCRPSEGAARRNDGLIDASGATLDLRDGVVTIVVGALLASLGGAGCRSTVPSPLQARTAADETSTQEHSSNQGPAATKKQDAAAPRMLTLSYANAAKPVVGTETFVTAEGLPPRREVDLVWETVNGGWVIENGYHFRGKQFTKNTTPLGRAEVSSDGRLATRFTIPEDYGGVHGVIVSEAGVPLAQGGVEVNQTFEMLPAEGSVGTPIEIRAKGLGWRTMDSTWVVNWDNQQVGWISATITRGTAVARFRATGAVGQHEVKIYTGYMGQGYLNHEQAPNAYLPTPRFVFRVTPGRSVAAGGYAEPYQPQEVAAAGSEVAGATIRLSPTQGSVRTQASLRGGGFPANAPVSLIWGTEAGSRVTDAGFAPKEVELAKITVGADGRLSAPFSIPDDLGGQHTLSVRSGDKTIARAFFVIETSVVGMSPTSGPPGTPVTIHLKGVGWTDYDNIYVATYDNAYMGYVCGFNSQGDVVINFTAAGSPGAHLIDFYPGIYQGPGNGQQLYRLPQLTYADDHPGNKIPALRFAFEVTPASAPPALPVPTEK
jgi:hypothetical protein